MKQTEQAHAPEKSEEHFVSLARTLIGQFWKTNDVYYGGRTSIKEIANPQWIHRSGIWTNEIYKSDVIIRRPLASEQMPWKRIRVEFKIKITNSFEKCEFEFLENGSDKVLIVHNKFYTRPNIPYRYGDWKPIHTNEQEARQKAAEYAAMLGLPDLWDKTKFQLRAYSLTDGMWSFHLTPRVNGHSTLYPISVSVADLPGYPLGRWLSCMYQIPTNMPTKVALTSEEAQVKAGAYLKKYFPLKELIPRLTFHSNHLEYIVPDYNYIRPADETGFSNYEPRHDEVALVWTNTFKKPEGEGFPWVTIYVDAATGEMLGGAD